jgi:hypothetical protein
MLAEDRNAPACNPHGLAHTGQAPPAGAWMLGRTVCKPEIACPCASQPRRFERMPTSHGSRKRRDTHTASIEFALTKAQRCARTQPPGAWQATHSLLPSVSRK